MSSIPCSTHSGDAGPALASGPPHRLPLFSQSGFADTVCLSLGWAPLRRGHPYCWLPDMWFSFETLPAWALTQPSASVLEGKHLRQSDLQSFYFFLNFYFVLGYSRLTNHVVVVLSKQRRDSAIHSCIHSPPNPPPIQAGLAKAFNWRKRTVTLHEPSYAFLYLNICRSKDAATQNTCEKKSTFLLSRVET